MAVYIKHPTRPEIPLGEANQVSRLFKTVPVVSLALVELEQLDVHAALGAPVFATAAVLDIEGGSHDSVKLDLHRNRLEPAELVEFAHSLGGAMFGMDVNEIACRIGHIMDLARFGQLQRFARNTDTLQQEQDGKETFAPAHTYLVGGLAGSFKVRQYALRPKSQPKFDTLPHWEEMATKFRKTYNHLHRRFTVRQGSRKNICIFACYIHGRCFIILL